MQMKKVKVAYTVMLVITGLFLIIPLLLRIPIVSSMVDWIMDGLVISDYKSSYLEVLGGIAGSWLAITGAIYTQRKFDEEKKAEDEKEKREELDLKNSTAIVMCKELLWNEIRANHHAIMVSDGKFIEALMTGQNTWHYDGKNRHRINNWKEIRERVIDDNLDCAIKVMGLYKYYEFLSAFNGTAKEAKDLSQIDFSKYLETYKTVTKYLGIEE